jgi:hypothetical protein
MVSVLLTSAVHAEPRVVADPIGWRLIRQRASDGFVWSLFEQEEIEAGRPAFRVEADFEVEPAQAVETLMDALGDETPTTSGERRRLIERSPHGALVHTFIDLPMFFSDRELVIRLEHSVEAETGIHRVGWHEANEVLPPPEEGVLRLASDGFWEFHPGPTGQGTHAVYVTRAEVGGSLPQALSDRLMRGQAEDAVRRLRRLLDERATAESSTPPPNGDAL